MACLSSLVKNTIVTVSAVGSLSVITAVKVCVSLCSSLAVAVVTSHCTLHVQ